jgi:hypothetical protein
MEVAMRHGVLGYEAMGLSPAFFIFRFGVFIYEATRALSHSAFFLDNALHIHQNYAAPFLR